MKTSDSLNEIFTALSKAQGEFKNAMKDSENPFFKSTYANFESVVGAIRESLAKNGLSFVQMPSLVNEKMVLVTRICHSSGQWIEGEYPINPVKNDPQGYGSATTYAKRYALAAAFGVVDSDDDDGEKAQGRGENPKTGLASKEDVVSLFKKFEKKIGVSKSSVLSFLNKKESEITSMDIAALNKIGYDIQQNNILKEDVFK